MTSSSSARMSLKPRRTPPPLSYRRVHVDLRLPVGKPSAHSAGRQSPSPSRQALFEPWGADSSLIALESRQTPPLLRSLSSASTKLRFSSVASNSSSPPPTQQRINKLRLSFSRSFELLLRAHVAEASRAPPPRACGWDCVELLSRAHVAEAASSSPSLLMSLRPRRTPPPRSYH